MKRQNGYTNTESGNQNRIARGEKVYFRPHGFRTEFLFPVHEPLILITPHAMAQMTAYVEIARDEIGWLGTVRRDGDIFLIDKIFLVEQRVTGTTTELSPDGLIKLSETLLNQGQEGLDDYNALRFWGHSHVHMDTNPSGKDDQTMQSFRTEGVDWFVRGIANKRGRLEFTIELFDLDTTIVDVPWRVATLVSEEIKVRATQEIKEKVTSPGLFSGYSNNSWANRNLAPQIQPPPLVTESSSQPEPLVPPDQTVIEQQGQQEAQEAHLL
jgi:hypothetical protein